MEPFLDLNLKTNRRYNDHLKFMIKKKIKDIVPLPPAQAILYASVLKLTPKGAVHNNKNQPFDDYNLYIPVYKDRLSA